MFHVILVLASIPIIVFLATFFPSSSTLFDAIEKLTWVYIAVAPSVLTIALGFSKDVLANILVSNDEHILTISVPQAVLPLTLVEVTVLPSMFAKAMRLVLFPIPYVLILAFPETIPLLVALVPLAFIKVIKWNPSILSLTVSFAFKEFSAVSIAIAKLLMSYAMAPIVQEWTLIPPTVFINHYAKATPFLEHVQQPKVKRLFINFNVEIWILF